MTFGFILTLALTAKIQSDCIKKAPYNHETDELNKIL
jgi:hypothetical protein